MLEEKKQKSTDMTTFPLHKSPAAAVYIWAYAVILQPLQYNSL